MNNDINEIKELLKSINKSLNTLKEHIMDDYYNEMSIEEAKMKLKMADTKLNTLGYAYNTISGDYDSYDKILNDFHNDFTTVSKYNPYK